MRRFWVLLPFLVVFLFAVFGWQYSATSETARTSDNSAQVPQRIISLAPNLTEIAYALGLGEQLVGATRYCNYPPAARALPRIGSFLDPDFEAIARLKPDLVLLLDNRTNTASQLEKLNIPTLTVRSNTLADIADAILQIGIRSQHIVQADALHDQLLPANSSPPADNAPRVLITIARTDGNAHLGVRYIAGQQDFYNDLIQMAGGINAYADNSVAIPTLDAEGILQLNPDVVIELFPAAAVHNTDLTKVRQRWQALHQISPLKAISNQHLHFIEADYTAIPGPRLVQLLVDIKPLIQAAISP